MHIIHANGVCLRSEESEGEARECWRQKSKRRKCCGSQWRDPPDLEFVFCVRRSSPAEGALATGAELSLPKAKNATLRLMVPMIPTDPTSNLTNPFLLSGVNPEPTVFFFLFALSAQIMSAGAIPVFVVRDWIKPFQEQIDWPSFSFSFTPDQMGPKMMEVLRAVTPDELLLMQVYTYEDWVGCLLACVCPGWGLRMLAQPKALLLVYTIK